MKEIALTQGKVATIDDADYEWLSQFKWQAGYYPQAHTWYAVHSIRQEGKNGLILMHRLIMNTPAPMHTDHVDHDGLHNWRGNLRVCTAAQNGQNRLLPRNNTSGYKGVSRYGGRWGANITYEGRRQFLGCFDTAEEAALAYNLTAKMYFGEFAYPHALD